MPVKKMLCGLTYFQQLSKGYRYNYVGNAKDRTRLHSPEGSKEFLEELKQAHARKTLTPKTIRDLCISYRNSADYKSLAESTRKTWKPWFKRLETGLGSLRIETFEASASLRVIAQWMKPWDHYTRAPSLGIQVLSVILSYAIQLGCISQHHCKQVRKKKAPNRAHIIWTPAEIDRFRVSAPPHIVRMFEFALLTGMRQGDILILRWKDIKENYIEITTSKSRGATTAFIPIYPSLAKFLATLPRTHDEFVFPNSRGKPWAKGFCTSWGNAKKKAGIDKHFHDLRGTAATKLHGIFSNADIALILGWEQSRVDRIIDHYVSRKARCESMLERMELALGSSPGHEVLS